MSRWLGSLLCAVIKCDWGEVYTRKVFDFTKCKRCGREHLIGWNGAAVRAFNARSGREADS